MHIALHIDIAASRERVFTWLSDPERAQQWMRSVAHTEILHEEPGKVGTRFRERVQEGERSTELTGEITDYDQNDHIAFALRGNENSVKVCYRLQATKAHTMLLLTSEVRFRGLTRLLMLLLGPMFKKKTVAQLNGELLCLKALCEQPGDSARG